MFYFFSKNTASIEAAIRRYTSQNATVSFDELLAAASELVNTNMMLEDLYPPRNDLPPLMIFSLHGKFELVKALVESGAQVCARSSFTFEKHYEDGTNCYANVNALILAVYGGHFNIVKYLFDKQQQQSSMSTITRIALTREIYLRSKNFIFALHLASQKGHLSIVQFFLNRGIDVNARDGSLETALHHAARSGHSDIVIELLYSGANPSLVSISGCTAKALAEKNGFLETARLLDEVDVRLEANKINIAAFLLEYLQESNLIQLITDFHSLDPIYQVQNEQYKSCAVIKLKTATRLSDYLVALILSYSDLLPSNTSKLRGFSEQASETALQIMTKLDNSKFFRMM